MTSLPLATVRELSSRAALTALLGKDADPTGWSTWIFPEKNYKLIENTGKVMLVVNTAGDWTGANLHNTALFPRIVIDVWADPTRNEDGSVKKNDAADKIEKVGKELIKVLHTTANQTPYLDDVRLIQGQYLDGFPEIEDVKGSEGTKMASFYFGLQIG